MNKLKQMEVTEKSLRERVETLRRERSGIAEFVETTTKSKSTSIYIHNIDEKNKLDKLLKRLELKVILKLSDDNSVDSIMSFPDKDDSDDDEEMKTFIKLHKQQSLVGNRSYPFYDSQTKKFFL